MDAAALAAARPVTEFEAGFADGFVTELRWDRVDDSANGIVVERCWPQGASLGCELAAALHPDARGLDYHLIQPWRFRVATFNADGVSQFTPLSAVVGMEHLVNTSDPAPLTASDSILARRIVAAAGESWLCTSPQALIAQVDAYDWFSCYEDHLPSLRVPFNPRGLQRPDVLRQ
jgi:hypothetical protein